MMKKTVLVLVAMSLLGAAASDAGWFSRDKRRLPKPIDSPTLRPKVRVDHQPGHTSGDHPHQ